MMLTTRMKLLVVESPAKCKKIQEYLGSGWRVQATMGHIRALKEELSAIGFKPEAGLNQSWNPTYEILDSKTRAIAELRRAAKVAESVYLGSDDDREGEAIAWHICAILGLDPKTTPRVVFHEITAAALTAAVTHPRTIDFNKFNAQQARCMLDLLIGFTLSPCLWRAIGFKPGLSAGRCQTPALRLIYDRDKAIEAHATATTWQLCVTTGKDSTELHWKGTTTWSEESEAESTAKALSQITDRTLTITQRKERIAVHKPPPPFITSSLQQEASSRLGCQPKQTMRAAQTLYEAGHITYMRTDNAILSEEAQAAAAEIVRERWGPKYLGAISVSATKKKKAAEPQAAHEAIRPTHMNITTPAGLSDIEAKLYNLIWMRTIQSIMAAEERDTVLASATISSTQIEVEASWDQTRFAGWRIIETELKTESENAAAIAFGALASIAPPAKLPWLSAEIKEQRTAPPSRYTEAALIRELESRGIGRPSTFATLVETVLERGYVEKSPLPAQTTTLRTWVIKPTTIRLSTRTEKFGAERDKLRTTSLGRTVIEWLLSEFGDMLDYNFTASMESQLDAIAQGSNKLTQLLDNIWKQYGTRYANTMKSATGATGATGGQTMSRGDLGDGYKIIVSKKGPIFVREQTGQPTRFASVPPNITPTTATQADAIAAFAAADQRAAGEVLGELDGTAVVRKTGKFGKYIAWGDVSLNCAEDATFDYICTALKRKKSTTSIDHTVGSYRIKNGQYGLYMYKMLPAGSKTKPVFVNLPDSTPWATMTPETAEAFYKYALANKKSHG